MSQRSSIIFWLLLAATICVDAVVILWAYEASISETEALYFGLACGQISVLCVGAFFSQRGRVWWIAPPLGVIAVTGLTTWLFHRSFRPPIDAYEQASVYLSLWLIQCAIVLVGLWLWQPAHPTRHRRWRFATRHLLILMTATAVILAVLRQAESIQNILGAFIVWTVNNAVLSLAAVVIRARPWHSILRLAGYAAVALALALGIELMPGHGGNPWAINLIQAGVLAVWLELGQIMPVVDAAYETES